jgi:hypothetical protein
VTGVAGTRRRRQAAAESGVRVERRNTSVGKEAVGSIKWIDSVRFDLRARQVVGPVRLGPLG